MSSTSNIQLGSISSVISKQCIWHPQRNFPFDQTIPVTKHQSKTKPCKTSTCETAIPLILNMVFFANYIAKDGLFWKLGSQFPISRAHPNIFCWIYECRSYYIISPITHMYFSKIWCVYNIDLITSYYILSPITHIIHNIWWFKLSIKSIIRAVPSSSFQGKKNLDPREDPTQVAKTPQRNALLLPAVRPPAMKKNHRKTGFQGAICIDIEYVCVCVYIYNI